MFSDMNVFLVASPSMKVPPKRKGNSLVDELCALPELGALNESPSEKEGKSRGGDKPRRDVLLPQ